MLSALYNTVFGSATPAPVLPPSATVGVAAKPAAPMAGTATFNKLLQASGGAAVTGALTTDNLAITDSIAYLPAGQVPVGVATTGVLLLSAPVTGIAVGAAIPFNTVSFTKGITASGAAPYTLSTSVSGVYQVAVSISSTGTWRVTANGIPIGNTIGAAQGLATLVTTAMLVADTVIAVVNGDGQALDVASAVLSVSALGA